MIKILLQKKSLRVLFIFIGAIKFLHLLTKLKNIYKKIIRKKLNFRTKKKLKKIKWALITGGTDGIGKKLYENLIKENIGIIILGKNEKKIKYIENYLKEIKYKNYFMIQKDLSILNEKQNYDEIFWKEFFINSPKIDLLINNAGISFTKKILDGSYKNFEDIINVNFMSFLVISNYYLKFSFFRKNFFPNIIYISSIASFLKIKYCLNYNFSKNLSNKVLQILKKK